MRVTEKSQSAISISWNRSTCGPASPIRVLLESKFNKRSIPSSILGTERRPRWIRYLPIWSTVYFRSYAVSTDLPLSLLNKYLRLWLTENLQAVEKIYEPLVNYLVRPPWISPWLQLVVSLWVTTPSWSKLFLNYSAEEQLLKTIKFKLIIYLKYSIFELESDQILSRFII